MVLGDHMNGNAYISFWVVADLCPSLSGCNAGKFISSVIEGIIVLTEMVFWEQVFFDQSHT